MVVVWTAVTDRLAAYAKLSATYGVAGLLPAEDFHARQQEVVEVRRMLIGLLKKLRPPANLSRS